MSDTSSDLWSHGCTLIPGFLLSIKRYSSSNIISFLWSFLSWDTTTLSFIFSLKLCISVSPRYTFTVSHVESLYSGFCFVFCSSKVITFIFPVRILLKIKLRLAWGKSFFKKESSRCSESFFKIWKDCIKNYWKIVNQKAEFVESWGTCTSSFFANHLDFQTETIAVAGSGIAPLEVSLYSKKESCVWLFIRTNGLTILRVRTHSLHDQQFEP